MWVDEAGISIPYARITKFERTAEQAVYKMAVEAQKIHEALSQYKASVIKEAERLYELFTAENGAIGKGKGGATFYNFDRTIKVVVNVSEPIQFDENTIELAKLKIDEVIMDGLVGAKDWAKPMLMDAFQLTNGKLDTKKVLGLRKYEDRISDPRYSEAMKLINKAIRRSSTKEYYQVWVKDAQGEYQNIQLNFASI